MITSADFDKAIFDAWLAHGVDWEFKKLWAEANRSIFPSLQIQEAAAEQPWPYAVFEKQAPSVANRMTGDDAVNRYEIRNTSLSFRIHARQIAGINKSAKQIAADLAEYVIGVFGGHPLIAPKDLILTHGGVLLVQYQTDYCVKEGPEEHQWVIDYLIQTDVPIAG